jgi:mRNA-degrading endonuclease RelE of RelBE toxin-antitoxin system
MSPLDFIRHWLTVSSWSLLRRPYFTKRIVEFLDDEEYGRLQSFLNEYPGMGKMIRGSGGIRKLRWAGSGRGKRGGLRVIYYWWVGKDRISMLTVYPKSERDDLTADQLRQLRNQLAP